MQNVYRIAYIYRDGLKGCALDVYNQFEYDRGDVSDRLKFWNTHNRFLLLKDAWVEVQEQSDWKPFVEDVSAAEQRVLEEAFDVVADLDLPTEHPLTSAVRNLERIYAQRV